MTSKTSTGQEIKQHILTPHGEVPLESITEGQTVLGFNYDTRKQEKYIVTKRGAFGDNNKWLCINSQYYFASDQSLYVNGNVLHASEIHLGDCLEDITGSLVPVVSIEEVTSSAEKILLVIEKRSSLFDRIFHKKTTQSHTYYIDTILVHNASRFWVGGTNTWDATTGTKWAASTGGAGGASAPTAADDVFFDANSGVGTITLNTGAVCRSLNCTGFTGTLSHAAAFTLLIGDATAGASNIALKFVAGMTYTLGNASTSAITFNSSSATVQTIDTGGKNMGNITAGGTGKSQLISSFSSTTGFITINAGTFDTNGQTVSSAGWTINGASAILTLGASNITCTNTSGNPWNVISLGTLNANTSTITMSGVGTVTFAGGGKTYNNFTITNTGNKTITGQNTFNNVTWIDGSGLIDSLILSSNQIVTGTLSLTGVDSATNCGFIYVLSTGFPSTQISPRTITANTVALTNVIFSDIIGAGAASWTGTRMGDAGGNSGITFDSPTTRYWVGAPAIISLLARWASTSGGIGGSSLAPLPQDICIFDANSFTGGGTFTLVRINPALDFSNAASAFALSVGLSPASIYGNFAMKSGSTTSGNGVVALIGRGTHTLNMNGVAFGSTAATVLQISALGGSYTLQNDISIPSTGIAILIAGTFDANGFNVTTGGFSVNPSGAPTRQVNMGSGTWTMTGVSFVWNLANPTNLTLNASTSTLLVTDSSAAAKTIDANARTLNNVTITGGGGATISIGHSWSCNNLTVLNGNTIIQGSPGNTLTVNGIISAVGTAGNLITINSSTPGSLTTISQASGVSSCDYLSLQDSNAVGGALFYAGKNSVNVSNNTGWIFASYFFSNLTDSITPVGSLLKSISRGLPLDSITPIGVLLKSIGKVLSDSFIPSDTVSKSTNKTLSATVSPIDSLLKACGANFANSVSFSESITKSTARSVSDSVPLLETVTRLVARTLTDSLSIIEAIINKIIPSRSPIRTYMRQKDKSTILR